MGLRGSIAGFLEWGELSKTQCGARARLSFACGSEVTAKIGGQAYCTLNKPSVYMTFSSVGNMDDITENTQLVLRERLARDMAFWDLLLDVCQDWASKRDLLTV